MYGVLNPAEAIGVDDFVLLEAYTSQDAFLENLRIRYSNHVIYTYIGPVLVSVNPYQKLDIYGDNYVQKYKDRYLDELPPHIFAIANNSYRRCLSEANDQCILVSGESGAGKTEATKYIIEFIAATSVHSESMSQIKDILIRSNYVLEAFGNATTTKNENSSRFGKYIDIQFDFAGAPNGGRILNYLLEKSRVIYQGKNERNFHIFYQVLAGVDDQVLEELGLVRDLSAYAFLTDGSFNSSDEQVEKDKAKFDLMFNALQVCNIIGEKRMELLRIISAILHLGNIKFVNLEIETNPNDLSYKISDEPTTQHALAHFSWAMSLSQEAVEKVLINRKFHVPSVEDVESLLNVDQANYLRDSFAKSIYECVFNWIIKTTNSVLETSQSGNRVGILDIYGFEIFELNSFEQFCINYCNEKLHELFIELTLRSEQEEYERESIVWDPIEFFDNKQICLLIEAKPVGIIDILDEECAMPGKADDQTFLKKLSSRFIKHPNYECSETNKERWLTLKDEFVIKHYAGYVTYSVSGFVNKNKNDLYRNFYELMLTSKNQIIKEIYVAEELTSKAGKKNPSVASQFRKDLKKLMKILYSKEPAYIRCIKPNMDKLPCNLSCFNDENTRHQVTYLSLMDNLRVRRAGYSFKRKYELFFKRFKCLCPSTWPTYTGEARQGVNEILASLGLIQNQDYSLGKTKVFIRMARTGFRLEDELVARKHELVTKIKAVYKGFIQRRKYLKKRKSVLVIQRAVRCWIARRKLKLLLEERARELARLEELRLKELAELSERLEKENAARLVIARFINGYLCRNEPYGETNKVYLRMMYEKFLLRLAKSLPSSFIAYEWPVSQPAAAEASVLLKKIHKLQLGKAYRSKLTDERKEILREKQLASEMFKDKKDSYPTSVCVPFQIDRCSDNLVYKTLSKHKKDVINGRKLIPNEVEVLLYKTIAEKYNRRGYKQTHRIFVLTQYRLYGYDLGSFKRRDQIDYDKIIGITVTKYSDGFIIIHILKIDENDAYMSDYLKGDLIIRCNQHSLEFVVKLCDNINKNNKNPNFLSVVDSSPDEYFLKHRLADGQIKKIQFKRSKSENNLNHQVKVFKDKKSKRLIVEV